MSWQKRSIQLILGLPISLPIVAYAVNIGDTYVQSQQNQPLNASINVSDIDPDTFSVKLASNSAYQQLGLSNDTKPTVKFEPTSSNGGKIVITTAKPLNAPFTDVVLDVTNKGETKTLPKTLLLPIDETKQVVTQSNTELVEVAPKAVIVGSANPVNLPVIDEPVPVTVNEPVQVATTNTPSPTLPVSTDTAQPTLKGSLDTSTNLIINETRRPVMGNSSALSAAATSNSPTAEPVITATNSRPKPVKDNVEPTADTTSDTQQTDTQETVTYVIQRNDNLWTIANELAKQNKADVNKVMKDIVAANPNAFENNDPSKLIANSELNVPKYKVMPSQLGVKSANAVKEKTRTTVAKKPTQKTTKKSTTVAKRTTTAAKKSTVARRVTKNATKRVNRPATKTTVARRSEMKIIAPSQNNGSNQGSTQASKNVPKNSQTSQVVTQVQQKRQATAKQASKVGQLNQSLVSAEKRLKLQNAKLAQLEQRLKELNKK